MSDETTQVNDDEALPIPGGDLPADQLLLTERQRQAALIERKRRTDPVRDAMEALALPADPRRARIWRSILTRTTRRSDRCTG